MEQQVAVVQRPKKAAPYGKVSARITGCLDSRFTVILALLGTVSIAGFTSTTIASPYSFGFSGVIEGDLLDDLFPGKSYGDTYSGTFTVDDSAAAISSTPDAVTYDGSLFNVTIEGISHDIRTFRVWKTSPPGGGVQFSIDVGNTDSAFLSLRSTNNLYDSTDVPISYDIADFENAKFTHVKNGPFGSFLEDTGAVDMIVPDSSDPLTFDFSGVVTGDQLDSLFPNKSVGDAYSGSFTVDPSAITTHTAPNATVYNGSSFKLVIDGTLYSVHAFRVWNSSPPGGGIEFMFDAGGEPAFLSLRSASGLYGSTDVPTSFDVTEFDSLSRITQRIDFLSLRGEGSITDIHPIPEPSSGLLCSLGLMGSMYLCFMRRCIR